MNDKDLHSQLDTFLYIIKQNTDLMDILEYVETINLPNYYIAAGSIFQTVWNYYDRKPLMHGVKEKVESMQDGLDTMLYHDMGEGVDVSGGQAQKIAIARALYKDSPFVVLDEPTAALDPISEYEIYERFNEMVKDKTSIYISHRMSSCKFCDDILVFDKGQLIQRGSHRELMKDTTNVYGKLWNAQAKYYSEI